MFYMGPKVFHSKSKLNIPTKTKKKLQTIEQVGQIASKCLCSTEGEVFPFRQQHLTTAQHNSTKDHIQYDNIHPPWGAAIIILWNAGNTGNTGKTT